MESSTYYLWSNEMGIMTIRYQGDLKTRCAHGSSGQVILTEAPRAQPGNEEMFSPTDLVAIALGSCVLTVMGMAATMLKVDFSGARLDVRKEMVVKPSRMIGKLSMDIYCSSQFEPKITEQLEKAGRGCPVHHSLHPDMIQEFHFHWGEE